ncbi:MAG: TlyA family RNA methyltransferase [Actinobacteria bacterium]|nr:TlyA family RNA methyltransferase [Actinomycetota bacterium]MBM3712677.1 TlyA family RNA methyltransferase [Actinomycetota bacterium]
MKKLITILLERNLVINRNTAESLILEGKVRVDGKIKDKPGIKVSDKSIIEIKPDLPFVSRGGLKIQEAFTDLKISVKNKKAVDIGASTGGFTDFLLKNKASSVIAIDVGYGVLSWKLRKDPRVIVLERTNIRDVIPDQLPYLSELTVVDVSFISIKTVFKNIFDITCEKGEIVLLIKPQFEVTKEEVENKGVIKSKILHLKVLLKIVEHILKFEVEIKGLTFSKIKGRKGNMEYWLYVIKKTKKSSLNNKKTSLNYDKMIIDTVNNAYSYYCME